MTARDDYKAGALTPELIELIEAHGAFDFLVALESAFDELHLDLDLTPVEKRAAHKIATAIRGAMRIAEDHNI